MKATKLKSGNWNVRVYIGKTADGKDITKSITAPTKKEALQTAAKPLGYRIRCKRRDSNSHFSLRGTVCCPLHYAYVSPERLELSHVGLEVPCLLHLATETCSRKESNLQLAVRSRPVYPLTYGSWGDRRELNPHLQDHNLRYCRCTTATAGM